MLCFQDGFHFLYLALAKDTAGFIKAHDIVLNNYDFDTFIGGHLTKLGTRNDVIVQKEFVSDLQKGSWLKQTTKSHLVRLQSRSEEENSLVTHGSFSLNTLMQ